MIRGKKVPFRASSSELDRLFACNRESAKVWNTCVQIAKQFALNHAGKWISKTQLQHATKRQFHLHSQSTQAVCHTYLFARESARQALRKKVKGIRYPYRQKQHFNTKWAKDGFTIHADGKIELSMGIQDGKREKPIVIRTRNLPEGQIKEMELCYEKELYLSVTYEDGTTAEPYQQQRAVGVDPGEIHTLAAFCEKGDAVVITGRKVRSIHRLRNKKLAAISRLLAKCKKGSRNWKRYQKVKQFIRAKSERQLRDALHKTTKQFVDWCLAQEVSDVHLGNPDGVQRNTRKKKKASRKQAQRLSNWSFGKVRAYLAYKLEMQGIRLHEVAESYTSQTCPVCKEKRKVSSRNYRCCCSYREHRDIHGARNILAKGIWGEIRHFAVPTRATYLRIA
jgi:putative transposase